MDVYRLGVAAWRGSLGGKDADGSETLTEDSRDIALVDDDDCDNGWLGAVPRSVVEYRSGISESDDRIWQRLTLHTGVVL